MATDNKYHPIVMKKEKEMSGEIENGIPKEIFFVEKHLPFSIAKVSITIMDQKSKNENRRYKHIIHIRILSYKVDMVIRSSSPNFISINGKAVDLD